MNDHPNGYPAPLLLAGFVLIYHWGQFCACGQGQEKRPLLSTQFPLPSCNGFNVAEPWILPMVLSHFGFLPLWSPGGLSQVNFPDLLWNLWEGELKRVGWKFMAQSSWIRLYSMWNGAHIALMQGAIFVLFRTHAGINTEVSFVCWKTCCRNPASSMESCNLLAVFSYFESPEDINL